jgi:periplasmic protein TonB
MATCDDYLSDLTAALRSGSRVPMFSEAGVNERVVGYSRRGVRNDGLFEESLIVSGRKSRPRNFWAALGSLSLQALLLTAVVVIPLLHTDVLPKKETLTSLYLVPPPPPPPPAPAHVTRVRMSAPTKPTYNPKSISVPVAVEKTEAAVPDPVSSADGVVGGVPGGVVGGVPSGVIGGILAGSPRSVPTLAQGSAVTPARVHVAARVVEANLIHDVPPTYPAEAGRSRIEGTVVLRAVIGKDGTVQDVRVESGLPILAQAAIEAVKQWRYKPYLLNGEAVEVESRITINFALSNS